MRALVRALITPNSTIIQIHQYPELEIKISKIPNSQNSEFNQISRLCNQNKKKLTNTKTENSKLETCCWIRAKSAGDIRLICS